MGRQGKRQVNQRSAGVQGCFCCCCCYSTRNCLLSVVAWRGTDGGWDRMWDAASYQFANVLEKDIGQRVMMMMNMSEDGRFVINT